MTENSTIFPWLVIFYEKINFSDFQTLWVLWCQMALFYSVKTAKNIPIFLCCLRVPQQSKKYLIFVRWAKRAAEMLLNFFGEVHKTFMVAVVVLGVVSFYHLCCSIYILSLVLYWVHFPPFKDDFTLIIFFVLFTSFNLWRHYKMKTPSSFYTTMGTLIK